MNHRGERRNMQDQLILIVKVKGENIMSNPLLAADGVVIIKGKPRTITLTTPITSIADFIEAFQDLFREGRWKMTLEEAIDSQQKLLDWLKLRMPRTDEGYIESMQLGIEALKRFMEIRADPCAYNVRMLPGETEK